MTAGDGSTVTPLVEIILDEDLTAPAAGRLRALLEDALALRPAQLVVDLSACGHADAAAVEVLLEAHRRTFATGGRLTLRGPSPRLRRLLRLSHVDQVFHITPSNLDGPPRPLARAAGVTGPGGSLGAAGEGR